MLNLFGNPGRNCGGVTRRAFLQAGAAGMAGLTLPGLLKAEAAAGIGSSRKAIIHIHLDGGPSQMDLIDPKPGAPSEYRGEFGSLRTNLPGLHLTELMPRVASMADRFVFLRTLVGAADKHDAFQCQSGFDEKDLASLGGRPAMGCVAAKLLGKPRDPVPVFVDLMQGRGFARNSVRPGFLGAACRAFRPDISHLFHRELEHGMKIELARLGEAGKAVSLTLSDGLTPARLDDRIGLLKGVDQFRRDVDASGAMGAMDQFNQQAYGILSSGALAKAMDLSAEDPRMLERYTPVISGPTHRSYTSEGPIAARKLLLARRLVEAGVRVVSVSISDFDTHTENFSRMRELGPIVDHALHALVTDLKERGMLDEVTVLAWGEFGRTPKVNAQAGRDHWPRVSMGIMAGGGMRTGQVIGETDRHASEAVARPVHYQDVIATLYHNLGIDPRTTTVEDPTGRPQYLVDRGQPIRELI